MLSVLRSMLISSPFVVHWFMNSRPQVQPTAVAFATQEPTVAEKDSPHTLRAAFAIGIVALVGTWWYLRRKPAPARKPQTKTLVGEGTIEKLLRRGCTLKTCYTCAMANSAPVISAPVISPPLEPAPAQPAADQTTGQTTELKRIDLATVPFSALGSEHEAAGWGGLMPFAPWIQQSLLERIKACNHFAIA